MLSCLLAQFKLEFLFKTHKALLLDLAGFHFVLLEGPFNLHISGSYYSRRNLFTQRPSWLWQIRPFCFKGRANLRIDIVGTSQFRGPCFYLLPFLQKTKTKQKHASQLIEFLNNLVKEFGGGKLSELLETH